MTPVYFRWIIWIEGLLLKFNINRTTTQPFIPKDLSESSFGLLIYEHFHSKYTIVTEVHLIGFILFYLQETFRPWLDPLIWYSGRKLGGGGAFWLNITLNPSCLTSFLLPRSLLENEGCFNSLFPFVQHPPRLQRSLLLQSSPGGEGGDYGFHKPGSKFSSSLVSAAQSHRLAANYGFKLTS